MLKLDGSSGVREAVCNREEGQGGWRIWYKCDRTVIELGNVAMLRCCNTASVHGTSCYHAAMWWDYATVLQ